VADEPKRRPLTLSEQQRRVMERRGIMLVQPRPLGVPPIPLGVRLPSGVPYDVALTLEALRMLAEQGNRVAAFVYEQECRSLGITPPAVN
jgi:hypothetical protein